ncbi:WEB family protein [Forsythia ovata]|uniref:WEB family protein n=1 Tax=Forsythia ovata TaxID=205694 RepID=A0ABD1WRN1_9LAMI
MRAEHIELLQSPWLMELGALYINFNEEEKGKKAMESLASALHEVSSEAREAKEKLLSIEVEHENYETQIKDLKLVVKATEEKYETMLDGTKQEIDVLTIEQSQHEYQNMKAEWKQK